MHVSTFEFAKLYSWYSWPNVILPFIGGFLMDRVFGIRGGTILWSLFIILGKSNGRNRNGMYSRHHFLHTGQVLFALGSFNDSYSLMQFGRFCFGIGGESLQVAQNTYAVIWFKGKELNMVFGLQLSIARIGSTVNFYVMVPLYNFFHRFYQAHYAMGWALTIAGGTCVMSLCCAVILFFLDRRAQIMVRDPKRKKSKEDPPIRFDDILALPATYWIVCITCLSYYVAVFPFVSLGQVFLVKKFHLTKTFANVVIGKSGACSHYFIKICSSNEDLLIFRIVVLDFRSSFARLRDIDRQNGEKRCILLPRYLSNPGLSSHVGSVLHKSIGAALLDGCRL